MANLTEWGLSLYGVDSGFTVRLPDVLPLFYFGAGINLTGARLGLRFPCPLRLPVVNGNKWTAQKREKFLEMSHVRPKKECPCFSYNLLKDCDFEMMMNCKKYARWHGANGYSDKRRKKGLSVDDIIKCNFSLDKTSYLNYN